MITAESTMREVFEYMREMSAAIMTMEFKDDEDVPTQSMTLTDGRAVTAMLLPAVKKVQDEYDKLPSIPPRTVIDQSKRTRKAGKK